jgi:hypothetical protein
MKQGIRPKIPIETQVRIFFRDSWMCRWCDKPTIFAPALKYMEKLVKDSGYEQQFAYYDLHYRPDKAPLLDLLAATIDHVVPFSKGGDDAEGNLVTACNKCNMRKSDRHAEDFTRENPLSPVTSRYGEPKNWDGLVSFFVMIGRQHPIWLTSHEKNWLKAIEMYLLTSD